MHWKMKLVNLATNQKLKVNFCLTEFNMTKIVVWVFHMDDSTEIVYGLIPGRYYLTALGLTLKLSNNTMSGGDRPFKGCTAPMVNLGKYNLKK